MSKFVRWEDEDYTEEWYEERHGDPDDVYTEYLRTGVEEQAHANGSPGTDEEPFGMEDADPWDDRRIIADIASRHGIPFDFDAEPVPEITPGDVERAQKDRECFPDLGHCCLESGTLGDPGGPHVRWAHYEYLGFGPNCVGPGVRACVLVNGQPLGGEDAVCHVVPKRFAPMLEYLVGKLKTVPENPRRARIA
ncbi:MAG: hypothetical protein M5U26_11880 [Planctomycetota bacterium]|nr:hypothetical protein [Planctomycetota bacterium]